MTDTLRIADQAQHRRPDDHPGKQITQHRPQLQPLGQRHGEHRREQKHDSGLQQIAFMGHEKNSIHSVRWGARIKAGVASYLPWIDGGCASDIVDLPVRDPVSQA